MDSLLYSQAACSEITLTNTLVFLLNESTYVETINGMAGRSIL